MALKCYAFEPVCLGSLQARRLPEPEVFDALRAALEGFSDDVVKAAAGEQRDEGERQVLGHRNKLLALSNCVRCSQS